MRIRAEGYSPMALNATDTQERLIYVTPAKLKRQIELVLSAWGMTPDKIDVIADLLVETDLRGIESHGASMLPLYDKMRRAGGLNMKPTSRLVQESPAAALRSE